mmetsp:Transcript_29649/g.53799  ORF Transcript_29649/g.53799 Transcript_29649/m.53799 type:complete len:97 (+) Transcript_29649:165-455(+)
MTSHSTLIYFLDCTVLQAYIQTTSSIPSFLFFLITMNERTSTTRGGSIMTNISNPMCIFPYFQVKFLRNMMNECRKKMYILDKNSGILHSYNARAF